MHIQLHGNIELCMKLQNHEIRDAWSHGIVELWNQSRDYKHGNDLWKLP